MSEVGDAADSLNQATHPPFIDQRRRAKFQLAAT
jgi:hypothetical protein